MHTKQTFINPIRAGGGPQRPPHYIFMYISFVSKQNKMKFGDFS